MSANIPLHRRQGQSFMFDQMLSLQQIATTILMNFPLFRQVCCEAKDDVVAPSSPILDPAVVVAMRELPDAPSHVPRQQQQRQQQQQQQQQLLQQPHPLYQQVAITGDSHLVEVLNNEAGPSSSIGMNGARSSSSGGSSGGLGGSTSSGTSTGSGRRSSSETITPFLLMQKMLQGDADLHLPTGEQTIGSGIQFCV